MKIIVESDGTRRFINSKFRIYGTNGDLAVIAKAIENALNHSLSLGWVDIGSTLVKDETIFPMDITASEKPTFPWGK